MGYTTSGIRNIALVGQAGAGKTSLVETLLLQAGAIRSRGSLARGSTVSDFDPQERRLQHSLHPAICSLHFNGSHVDLIDTPGYADFLGKALSVLEAVEAVAVVVSAVNGVDTLTQRLMEFARERELGRIVIVNKIDSRDAHCSDVLAQLHEACGRECLPLNLPAGGGDAVVDCFFQPHGRAADFSSVDAAHTQIIDQVVELDEKLMALYLEQGEELSPEQLHDPFEQALREGHLVPVCFASAESGAGIPELLQVFERLMPNPAEGNAPPFLKGAGEAAVRVAVTPDPAKHVIAHVFKVSIDPYVGKLGVLRVHQGTVRQGSQLFVGDARKPIKIAHLYRLLGKETTEIGEAVPGDICAIAKVDELHLDAVLHDSHEEDQYHLKPVAFPPAILGVAIQPERRGDEKRLADTLHKLTAEDPCVRIEHHAAVNETVLYGMGEFHVRVLLERMSERYGVQVKTHPPSIPYRETVTRPAEGHCRHKKQTGGAGQFGEVYLRIEALARGVGFEFVDDVVGGAIPGQYIPAVEKGVRQVLTEGALAGFPIQDVRVTVYDGKHHPVDSKEVAFVSAGRKAFLDALAKARPIVLEPIVNVDIVAPEAKMGDIAGELSGHRGHIRGSDAPRPGLVQIKATAPLSELEHFPARLKSITAGHGSYSLEFSHYEAAPPQLQQKLRAAHKPQAEAE